ncbi:MAG: saccharopine dehydrogenase NADP-binding domain-containing protein [Phormidesmis sp.]
MLHKDYDIVLYGATGFVGKQAASYLAQQAPPGLRWALAGRDRTKLEQVQQQVQQNIGPRAFTIPILVADSQDQEAVNKMVSQTRVVLNTAGPFALYGSLVVNACVRFQTHYVDITGETAWIKSLITYYHHQAAMDGTRIIPACGFDSVPSDIGSYLIARYMRSALGVACTQVKAYYQLSGEFNGGTLATNFNRYESGQVEAGRDLFLLNPPLGSEQSHSLKEIDGDPVQPVFDPHIGTWVGPFVMGPVNTRVVRRSAALLAAWGDTYPADFHYQEYTQYDPPMAYAKATLATGLMSLSEVAFEWEGTRQLLKQILPKPGTGPSADAIESGWFTTELIGTATDGRQVRGQICFQGDPSNRATVCCVCESALALAVEEALPGGAERGGLLTPATGLGDVLIERLRKAGMGIEVPHQT